MTTGTVSGVDFRHGEPSAQFGRLAWPLVVGVASSSGAVAALRGWGPWLWAAAVTVTGFAVVGLASVGSLYLPATGLHFLGAALGRAG